mgnify:CR=1 FL=1
MLYHVFDTETSGLLDFNKDLMDPSQPRIVQLAALIVDETGAILDQMNNIIRPDGWTISEGSFGTHGISLERCNEEGVPMPEALARFNEMKARCQARVGFNISYDKRMLAREAAIYGIPHDSEGLESFDVMNLAKPFCKIPPTDKMMARGIKAFKPPKLEEAFRHFFGFDYSGAHNALNDALAVKQIFFAILKAKQEMAAA